MFNEKLPLGVAVAEGGAVDAALKKASSFHYVSSRLLFCTCRGPSRGRVRHRGGGARRRDALVLRGQSGLVLDGLVEGGLAHVPHVVLPRVRVVSDTPVKMMPLLLIPMQVQY